METGSGEGKGNSQRWVLLAIAAGLLLMAVAILGPIFASTRAAATRSTMFSNLKHLYVGWSLYASDYDERACPVKNWNELLLSHQGTELSDEHLIDPTIECPFNADCMPNQALGLNPSFDKKNLAEIGDWKWYVVFARTTRAGRDAVAGKELVPPGWFCYVALDGRTGGGNAEHQAMLRWDIP